MPKRKDFSLLNDEVKGEFWINKDTNKVVVFSHGFGVTRDARGMFTELASLIKDEYNIVLFDYSEIGEDGNTTTFPFSEQAKKLREVLKHTREKLNPKKVIIVAHSQGCIITGLVSPDNVEKIILVAGPTSAPGENIKKYFQQRPGTEIDESGISKIERSDGTTTFIQSGYWKDAYEVNPEELFLELARKSKVFFVRAKQDQVLTNEDYSGIKDSDIVFIEIDGNHDFEREDRKLWLNKMVELLNK